MSASGSVAIRWRVAAAACTAAAFVLFAWVAATWAWKWFGPAPASKMSAAPADPAGAIVASGLWSANASGAPAPDAPPPGEMRLLGVLAQRDGGGLAVFRTREGVRVVTRGSEVVPGTTLASIDATQVRLRDATGERTIELRRDPPAGGAADPRTSRAPGAGQAASPQKTASVRPAANPACAVPAGFAGPVLKLHAELLEGLIAQPESWRAMLAAEGGALVVREDGGFATMLGLAKGDRLLQANGIPLREPDDVTGAVLRPLVASRPVRIGGARGADARELLIVNAAACP